MPPAAGPLQAVPRSRNERTCQVEGCMRGVPTPLHHICSTHMGAAEVQTGGTLQRYCTACSGLHPLDAFVAGSSRHTCGRSIAAAAAAAAAAIQPPQPAAHTPSMQQRDSSKDAVAGLLRDAQARSGSGRHALGGKAAGPACQPLGHPQEDPLSVLNRSNASSSASTLATRSTTSSDGAGNSRLDSLILGTASELGKVDHPPHTLPTRPTAAPGLEPPIGATLSRATALCLAAVGGHAGRIDALLAAGASPDSMDSHGGRALQHAAAAGHVGCLRALLSAGATLDARDNCGRTALLHAAWNSHGECAELLLAAGASADAAEQQGSTAVHHAAADGHTACLGVLLSAGAAPGLANRSGTTALHLASLAGHAGCVAALLAAGAATSPLDRDGRTPLLLASARGQLACVEALIAAGAGLDVADCIGSTALHLAAANGHIPVVRALLAAGAEPSPVRRGGRTPLHLAAYKGHLACLDLLVAANAELEAASSSGHRALHVAAAHGHTGCGMALVHAGADRAARTASGESALHLAAASGHREFADALLAAASPLGDTPDPRGLLRTGGVASAPAVLPIEAHSPDANTAGRRQRAKQAPMAEPDPTREAVQAAEAAATQLLAEEELSRQQQQERAAAKAAKKQRQKERRQQASVAAAPEQPVEQLPPAAAAGNAAAEQEQQEVAAEAAGLSTHPGTADACKRGEQLVHALAGCIQQPQEAASLCPAAEQARDEQHASPAADAQQQQQQQQWPQQAWAEADADAATLLERRQQQQQQWQQQQQQQQQWPPQQQQQQWQQQQQQQWPQQQQPPVVSVHPDALAGRALQQLGFAGMSSTGAAEGSAVDEEGELEVEALMKSLLLSHGTDTGASSAPAPPTSSQQLAPVPAPMDVTHTGNVVRPADILFSDIVLGSTLRSTATTKSVEGTWQGHTPVVVEILSVTGASTPASSAHVAAAAQEIASLRHPNLGPFLGVCASPPAVVTEFHEGRGTLSDVLRRALGGGPEAAELSWHRRLDIASDAARGLQYLHSQSPPIVYRDLSTTSLLVDSAWRVRVESSLNAWLLGMLPPSDRLSPNPRWQAPEVLGDAAFSPAGDVYAYGMVLHSLLTWAPPWEGQQLWRVAGAVMSGGRPKVPAPQELPGADTAQFAGLGAYVALMQRCWEQDPAARPTFQHIALDLRSLVRGISAPQPPAAPASLLAPPRRVLECCICWEETAALTALLPCAHRAVCEGCAEDLLSGDQRCPICRAKVTASIKIYDC